MVVPDIFPKNGDVIVSASYFIKKEIQKIVIYFKMCVVIDHWSLVIGHLSLVIFHSLVIPGVIGHSLIMHGSAEKARVEIEN